MDFFFNCIFKHSFKFLAPIPSGSNDCTISMASFIESNGTFNSSDISSSFTDKYPLSSMFSIMYMHMDFMYLFSFNSIICSCKYSFNDFSLDIKLKGEVSSSLL